MACDSNGIHDGAAIWLFHFFVKKSASTVLNIMLASKHKAQSRILLVGNTTALTTYPQAVNCLLRTYATDEDIAGTKDEISMLPEPPNKTPSECVEELVAKAIQCGDVYKKHDLNGIFIKGLDISVQKSTRC